MSVRFFYGTMPGYSDFLQGFGQIGIAKQQEHRVYDVRIRDQKCTRHVSTPQRIHDEIFQIY